MKKCIQQLCLCTIVLFVGLKSTGAQDLYNGGSGDGFASISYVQSVPDFFNGGSGDGFTMSTLSERVLPIELLSFSGDYRPESGVALKWSTATELNNDYFEVSRVELDNSSIVIGTIDGGGTSSSTKSYSFLDNNPIDGLNFYSLKQVDFDGTASLSKTIVVNVNILENIEVFPNPANLYVTLRFKEIPTNNVELDICNSDGKLVFEDRLQIHSLEQKIWLKNLENGVYLIEVRSGHLHVREKVIIQR